MFGNKYLTYSIFTSLNFYQNPTFFRVWIESFHLERLPLEARQVAHMSAAQRNGFTPETIIHPFVWVLQVTLRSVGKADPENRAIPGSICVVIHCTWASRVSGGCLTDGIGEAAGVATSRHIWEKKILTRGRLITYIWPLQCHRRNTQWQNPRAAQLNLLMSDLWDTRSHAL